MSVLILGMIIFVGVHMVPSVPGLRAALAGKLGELGYKGLHALVALAGLGAIIYGKASAGFVAVWQPPFPHAVAAALVLLGFMIAPATRIRCNFRRFTRHPLLWGVTLWAAGHLAVNGDLASIILFAGFALFSLAAMISLNRRGAMLATEKYPLRADVAVVLIGAAAYAVMVYLHPHLFGVPAIPAGAP